MSESVFVSVKYAASFFLYQRNGMTFYDTLPILIARNLEP